MNGDHPEFVCCACPELPDDLRLGAAWEAVVMRPSNAPDLIDIAYSHPHRGNLPPEAITLLKSKFWPNGSILRVAFLVAGRENRALNDRVLQFANLWGQYANVSFTRWTRGGPPPDIVVSYHFEGYWSYVGTDCRAIARQGQPTLNLQGFDTGRMPDSEWYRVVCHEVAHALGALHEQCRPEIVERIDPAACYDYFGRTQGWDRAMIDAQIRTPLRMTGDVLASPVEETSIMEYALPAEIMKDRKPVVGGTKITQLDAQWMARAYPGRGDLHPHLAALALAPSANPGIC
jgi:hypothetical protein